MTVSCVDSSIQRPSQMHITEPNGQVHGTANGIGNGNGGLHPIEEEQEDNYEQGIEVCWQFEYSSCISRNFCFRICDIACFSVVFGINSICGYWLKQ